MGARNINRWRYDCAGVFMASLFRGFVTMATYKEYVRVAGPDDRPALSMNEGDDMTASYDRELGSHSARLQSVEDDLKTIKTDIREIRDVVVQGRGGWRALTIVGAVAATISAAVTKLLPFLIALPR